MEDWELDFKVERPFFDFSRKEILERLELSTASKHLDIEVSTLAYDELDLRGKSGKAKQILDAKGIAPIPWLRDAKRTLKLLDPPPKKHRHGWLYTILLSGYTAHNGIYGIYVGSSKYTPEERFRQHLQGHRSARKVPNRGLQLIRSLQWPWCAVPGTKSLRENYETSLHLCLETVVPKVAGDCNKPEDWPEGFQQKLRAYLSL